MRPVQVRLQGCPGSFTLGMLRYARDQDQTLKGRNCDIRNRYIKRLSEFFATQPWHVDMSDFEKAARVFEALKAAEGKPAQVALPLLNELVSLVQGSGEASLEVEEARSGSFMAICEIGKALHRGQPVDGLWATAIGATERWMALTR